MKGREGAYIPPYTPFTSPKNNMTALNMTTSAVSSFASGSSWFGTMIIICLFGLVLSFFIMALSSINNYLKAKRWLKSIISSVKYFFFGILSLVVLAIPIGIFYYFFKQANQGNVVPIKVTGAIIAGYAIISFIGYLSKKYVYDRIKKFEKKKSKTT